MYDGSLKKKVNEFLNPEEDREFIRWRDQLIPASFRGQKFYVNSTTESGGRRLVKHEYPNVDGADYEDLGDGNNSYRVTGFLIGHNYLYDKEQLKKAFREKNASVLSHPYLGELNVKVPSWSITEEKERGRYCVVDATFVLENEINLTVSEQSAISGLADKKQNFLDKVFDAFEQAYDIAKTPSAVINDVISIMGIGLDVIEAAKNVTGTVYELKASISNLKGKIRSVYYSAQVIAQDFNELIQIGTDPADPIYGVRADDEEGYEQYTQMSTVADFDQESKSKYPLLAERKNYSGIGKQYPGLEFEKLISRLAIGAQIGLLGTMEIQSTRDANDIITDLNTRLKRIEQDEYAPKELIESVEDLRVTISNIMKERYVSLKTMKSIELQESLPSSVLAYNIYEDSTRDMELVNENDIYHPGFLPEKVTLYFKE